MNKGTSRSALVGDLQPIKVGLIHSLSGMMAVSERPLLEAEMLAIDEINKTGGVLDCQIEPVIMDGASDPETFAQKAQELLSSGVQFLFGCWTSASRKAVKPLVEDADGLLWYPVQYEGLEKSGHVVYTGSCPVQQIVPAVEWVIKHIGSRIFLVGSNGIFSRMANNLIQSEVQGRRGSIVGERYVPQDGMDFASIIEAIKMQKPDAVFSTVFGESNIAFYRQYRAAGIDARSIPVMGICLSEVELRSIADAAAGHYACQNYFQSLNRPENQRFVANIKKRCGEAQVCSAAMASAYTQIYLWKLAVEAAGSLDATQVRSHVAGCEFVGPTGPIVIQQNHHTSMSAYIGRATPDGQFEIIDTTFAIRPLPWLGVEESKLLFKTAVEEAMAAFPNVQNALADLAAGITERKRALGESEERFRRITENMTDMVAQTDLQGICEYASPRFKTVLGYDPKYVQGRSLFEFVHPNDIDNVLEIVLKALATSSTATFDYRYKHADGHYVWLESVGNALFDKTGQVTGTVLATRDITERKGMEAKLRDSEQLYRTLADSTPDLIFIVGRDTSVQYMNRSGLEHFGLAQEGIIGKKASDFFTPEVAKNVDGPLSTVFQTGKSVHSENEIPFQGIATWRDEHWIPLQTGCETTAVLGISRDITELKRTELALRERMRELNCLYGIARSVEQSDSNLDAIMGKVVSIIPPAYKYPDIACARIVLGNQIVESAGFKESRWSQSADIKVLGNIAGRVEVYYLEEKPTSFEGPFLKEERELIGTIAERLGRVVERKRTQDALHESEEEFRRIAENTVDNIFELNLDGTIRYDSPASERILGYKPEEITGRSAELLFSDSELPKLYDSLAVIANGKNVERLETEMLRKDGSRISVEVNASPMLREGRIVGALGILRDITRRKQADEALRESEQRFRRITENMTDIIVETDLRGACEYASPSFKTVLGYDPKDMPGKSLFELIHPDDIDNVVEVVGKALATGRLWAGGRFECRYRHADGHYVWLENLANIVRDEKGKMIGAVVGSRDITQRKQIEEVLRESEDRYRTLFDSTNDAIFIHEMGGKFLEVNRVACERLGYSREELLQMTPTDIDSPEYAVTAPQRIEELRKLGHSFSEIAQVRRDGTIIQTELSSRIVDYKGKPAVLSVARDITERKQVERLKDQFVSTVSHELRTPLTAIRASIGLLASGASGTLPKEGQRMLEIAVNNTDRLVRLINDILDSERLVSGKTPMEEKQCSAAQLVTQAADVMKPMAEKAGISLSVASQDAALWADPDRIVQALTNLISNAIKFSPKGARIWVTAEPKENQMLFKVRDEGRGIPSDKLGLLFERFQQVDASDAREKSGSGLGLSISKSIVEQHSGRIWAESTIGNGSTFFFALPLPQETEVSVQPEAMTEAQSARIVLIIEDDPDLADILATMLQRHDIQAYLALTGEKGITLSKQIHPDMIVLDLGLPDMDGSAVVQVLREDNALRSVPLIVYTVRELDKQQRENLRLGETLFFTKSRIPPDQFEEKVLQFMKRILENRGKTGVS